MYPIDPAEIALKQNKSPMAPPYVDDDTDIELTEMGMRIAEDEKRDLVTDAYEADAIAVEDAEETLDDIAYPKGNPSETSPEVSAMKEDLPPALE